MIINDKGKLFGVVSIVDILVVLAILVCVVGVYVRFIAPPGKTVSQEQTFTYQLRVKSIRQVSVDAFQQSIGTKFLLDEKGRNDILGELMNVKVEPAKDTIIKIDGTAVMAEMTSRYDVILTIKLDGQVTDKGYFTNDFKDIGIGGRLFIRNKFVKSEAIIEAVN